MISKGLNKVDWTARHAFLYNFRCLVEDSCYIFFSILTVMGILLSV